jgi:hypothetical protein
MSVWELTAYDTEMRNVRCREYTRSQRTAELWEQIPRIQFTDSGHGIVFIASLHVGRRLPTIRRMEWADKHLRALRSGKSA